MAVAKSSRKKGAMQKGTDMERGDVRSSQNPPEIRSQGNQPVTAATEEEMEEVGLKQRKRSTCPGIRVVGRRIYDSENGKTCHQCRQKTRDHSADCKNMKRDRHCTLKFCHKCLLNRYGESVEEVAALDDWHCPKCRGICNCSFCMKKKGHQPTGMLVHTAKATGFSSVSQMLQSQGPDNVPRQKDATRNLVSPVKVTALDEGQALVTSSKKRKGNAFGITSCAVSGCDVSHANPDEKKDKRVRKKNITSKKLEISGNDPEAVAKTDPDDIGLPEETLKEIIPQSTSDHNAKEMIKKKKEDKLEDIGTKRKRTNKDSYIMTSENQGGCFDVELPKGTRISSVGGIELSLEDVGNALQFIEFCATFGEILGMKKGQAECIMRDLMGGRGSRRGKYSSVVHFHIQLLTFLQQDLGEESPSLSPSEGKNYWLNALKSFLSESGCHLKDIVECIGDGNYGYDVIDCSQKLKLLVFLCDETLGTEEVRSWIEDQISKFAGRQKEAKEKFAAANGKVKFMKQKLQDEIAKALLVKNGAPLTISEHDTIVSEIKAETSKAHADMMEAKGLVFKRQQRSDAVRTEPILSDARGRLCWRLKGYGNSQMVIQDCGSRNPVTSCEEWFSFDAEGEKWIERHLPLFRMKRRKLNKDADAPMVDTAHSDLKMDYSANDDDVPPVPSAS